jgi:Ser/Thr protein kinase RdoA (MazF antagonist)
MTWLFLFCGDELTEDTGSMSFNQQSYTEQTDALTILATQAAMAWGLSIQSLDLISYTNNAVFCLKTPDSMYALQVRRPDHKPLAWIQSERTWINTLSHHPELRVHRPVMDVYQGELQGHEGVVYCTLTTWLTGQALSLDDLTNSHLDAIGKQIARLHNASAAFIPPQGFTRPRLDWDGLFGQGGAYDPKDGMAYFAPEYLELMDYATDIIRETMRALGNHADVFGIIHGDLIAKNFVFNGDDVGIIDTEECAYGYYLYDLTPIMWLARNTPRAHAVIDTLWAAYTDIRPQPEPYRAYVDVFIMARHIASCRWVAGNANHPNLRGRVHNILKERMDELANNLGLTNGAV